MKLFILIGQRNEQYEGEYSPEALAVIDENGDSNNPEYMEEELWKQEESGDFSVLTIIKLHVSDVAINRALFPSKEIINADVVL